MVVPEDSAGLCATAGVAEATVNLFEPPRGYMVVSQPVMSSGYPENAMVHLRNESRIAEAITPTFKRSNVSIEQD